MTDAFGRAIRDHHAGERDGPLRVTDGSETQVHPIEEYYFGGFDPDRPRDGWVADRADGPLLDLGAGAGRYALYFQKRFETVALEVSDALVALLRDRGVRQVRHGDMFELPGPIDADGFSTVLCLGTQIGLARSIRGLVSFLQDLARLTTADATIVLDGYDPAAEGASEMLGYRPDPTPGMAYRVQTYEYAGETDPTLLFRLFAPGRISEACGETDWQPIETHRPSDGDGTYYYRMQLRKH